MPKMPPMPFETAERESRRSAWYGLAGAILLVVTGVALAYLMQRWH